MHFHAELCWAHARLAHIHRVAAQPSSLGDYHHVASNLSIGFESGSFAGGDAPEIVSRRQRALGSTETKQRSRFYLSVVWAHQKRGSWSFGVRKVVFGQVMNLSGDPLKTVPTVFLGEEQENAGTKAGDYLLYSSSRFRDDRRRLWHPLELIVVAFRSRIRLHLSYFGKSFLVTSA